MADRRQRDEMERQLVEAYREGFSLREVAGRFGVSGSTVARTIRRVAPEAMRPSGGRALLSSAEEWQMVEAYREGAKSESLAARFGVSPGQVRKTIRFLAPGAMRPRGNRPGKAPMR